MYKKGLIVLGLLATLLTGKAQVSMTLQLPPVGTLVKNQLWNVLLVNSSNVTLMVRINLVLLDEQTNQPVLTATTAPIALPRGAKQIQAKDLGPIDYTYGNTAYHVDANPNGLLPTGRFQACYRLVNAYKAAPLAESCLQLNVDPLSPPLLNTPSDSGKIYTFYPQFTWLPPTPLGLFSDLSYALVLVQVLPGQTKGDAIQENVPVYNGTFIKTLYLNYPSSFRALDTGKVYAWRIVAMNGTQPAAMSDVWTFRVVAPAPPRPTRGDDSYIALKRSLDASVASCSGLLKLTYTNPTRDTLARYTITSLQEAGNPVVQQGLLPLRYGQNFVEVPLAGSYAAHKVYLFQFVNSRNETWSIKFTNNR
ncbi:hypothetical protein EDB95_3474 [Dinghuibacter silviterrae]|uniref:Fibronectin type-III domain-containing protein n=2 Tax=Dinghuibacter silviterrae TaxID=1539049 RepID=A0A4R8DWG3_9BACT|nr:hypothetical protein EDB95_3474 [Dinghuibacter silviterrae]